MDIAISYNWDNTENIDYIDEQLSLVRINIFRKKKDLKYKDSITGFAKRIAAQKYSIVYISKLCNN